MFPSGLKIYQEMRHSSCRMGPWHLTSGKVGRWDWGRAPPRRVWESSWTPPPLAANKREVARVLAEVSEGTRAEVHSA